MQGIRDGKGKREEYKLVKGRKGRKRVSGRCGLERKMMMWRIGRKGGGKGR